MKKAIVNRQMSGLVKTRFVRPSDEQIINVFDKEFSNEKVSKFSLNSKVGTLILNQYLDTQLQRVRFMSKIKTQ